MAAFWHLRVEFPGIRKRWLEKRGVKILINHQNRRAAADVFYSSKTRR